MKENPHVCESCLTAAAEEAMATEDETELLCLNLGDEIADHLCEEIETDGMSRCDCACHPDAKHALRTASSRRGATR